MGKEKIVTEKQLLDAIESYREQLCNTKSISETKYKNMNVALFFCKQIIKGAYAGTLKIKIP